MTINSKQSRIAMLAAGIGASGVAGFGLAFGKDAYKKTKQNLSLLILLSAAIVGPFLGGRGLVRGHDRSLAGTLFMTILSNILLIGIGFASALIIVYYAGIFAGLAEHSRLSSIIIGALALTSIIAAVGIIFGLIQRPHRLRAISISKENLEFLKSHGILVD